MKKIWSLILVIALVLTMFAGCGGAATTGQPAAQQPAGEQGTEIKTIRAAVMPQQLSHEPQVVFHYGMENSFGQWASGVPSEEHVICTVNTARAALDLVAAGVGVALVSEDCVQPCEGVRFLPVKNWYQALYMCILYDKWLEPPIWGFVEELVKVLRSQNREPHPED